MISRLSPKVISSGRINTINTISFPSDLHTSNSRENKTRISNFLTEVNSDCNRLNELILAYNRAKSRVFRSAPDRASKLALLRTIYEERKTIDNKYPDDLIGYCQSYQHQIQHVLFEQLKIEFGKLGILSMHEDALYEKRPPKDAPQNFAELIANMSLKKLSQMVQLLSLPNATGASLSQLYNENEPEYGLLTYLLKHYNFEYLDGKNSKNFKLTHIENDDAVVLKIENRINTPKQAEAYLRDFGLNNVLTPLSTLRRVTFIDSLDKPITRYVVITKFCKGGNLISYSKKILDDESRLNAAINIYYQVSDILIKMVKKEYMFLDMKNGNWLLDEKNRVQVSDTKGFIPLLDGIYNRENDESRWYARVSSKFMNPPEYSIPYKFSADKSHSFMLGKIIFQFLTQCSEKTLLNIDENGSFKPDEYPIFTDYKKGKFFSSLLQRMIVKEPGLRMPVEEVLSQLQAVQFRDLKNECKEILAQIESNHILAEEHMSRYITNTKARLKSSKTFEDFLALRTNMLTNQGIKKIAQLKQQCTDSLMNIDKESNDEYYPDMSTYIFEVVEALKPLQAEDQLQLLNDQVTAVCFREQSSITEIKKECRALLSHINAQRFGHHDTQMDLYINAQSEKMNGLTGKNELLLFIDELIVVDQNPGIKLIRQKVNSFHYNARFYTFGMKNKAYKIEQAMSKIPVLMRGNIFNDAPTAEESEVQKTLATHRHWFRPSPIQGHVIDEDKAANSYKELKQSFRALK